MKKITVFALSALSSLLLAAGNEWKLAEPVLPASFEMQGTLENDPARAHALLQIVPLALKWVKDLGPEGSNHLFHWEGDRELLANRTVKLVLTNSSTLRHPLLNGVSYPFDSYGFSPIVPGARGYEDAAQEIWIVVRVDRVMMDSRGELRPDCFFDLSAHLYRQIYGYVQSNLLRSVSELATSYSTPSVAEGFYAEIDRAATDSLRRLLNTPPSQIVKDRPLDLMGAIARNWWTQPENKGLPLAILPVPPKRMIGTKFPASLGSPREVQARIEELFGKALYLVYALPPEQGSRDPFCRAAPCEALLDRQLFFAIVDPSDKDTLSKMLPGQARVDGLFMPSDTLLAMLNPRSGGKTQYVVQTTLWSNDIFYSANGQWRSDALARLTLALAGEFYGAYPEYLLAPSSVPRTDLAMIEQRHKVLRNAVAIVPRLKANPTLWGWLSDAEKITFEEATKHYAKDLEMHRCADQVVRAALTDPTNN